VVRDVVSSLRPLVRDVARVDRAKIAWVTPPRNAGGTVAPLAVGAATGHLLVGLAISIGALNVAFSDRPGPYRVRAGQMALVSLISAVSLFVGGITGAIDGLAVALAALWGFGGGLLVALGPASTQIGLTSMVMLVVFAAQPLSPTAAAEQAGLILAGGLLQTLLAVAAWPVRRDEPQRVALAALLRQLAADTRASRGPDSPPPATAALTDASATVTGAGSDHSAVGEALRTLLDEAEGINLALVALDDTRHRRRDTMGQGTPPRRIDAVMHAAGDVLALLAEGLDTGRVPADTDAPLQRIAASARVLRSQATHAADGVQQTRAAAVLAGVEALASQLRAAMESATHAITGDEEAVRLHAPQPPALRLRAPVSILRANLTLRTAACRHAVRLACCFALADALGRTLDLPQGYWVPMTVAIVLKPDFAATFTHGLGRVAGTTVGLVLATGLVYSVFGEIPGRIVLVGVCMFVIRALGPANDGLLVIAVTALVVVLTSFAGARPEATIVARGIGTLIGGALALSAYAVWPTWERTQTPLILADLLDAYRHYVATIMAGDGDPRHGDPSALETARRAARLARSNAEASVDRLHREPARSAQAIDRADGLLANAHRFVHSAMALEAALHDDLHPAIPAALRVFVDDVETTLRALSQALRHPSSSLTNLPDLRADQRALADRAATQPGQDAPTGLAGYRGAIIVSEADRMTNSITTMTRVLRRQSDPAHASRRARERDRPLVGDDAVQERTPTCAGRASLLSTPGAPFGRPQRRRRLVHGRARRAGTDCRRLSPSPRGACPLAYHDAVGAPCRLCLRSAGGVIGRAVGTRPIRGENACACMVTGEGRSHRERSAPPLWHVTDEEPLRRAAPNTTLA